MGTLPNLSNMKKILVFGAGKSSTALIEYFLENAKVENWYLTVVDANLETVKEKVGNSPYGTAVAFDIMRDDPMRLNNLAEYVLFSLPLSIQTGYGDRQRHGGTPRIQLSVPLMSESLDDLLRWQHCLFRSWFEAQ